MYVSITTSAPFLDFIYIYIYILHLFINLQIFVYL